MIGHLRNNNIYSEYPEAECESVWDGSSSLNRINSVWKTGIPKFEKSENFLERNWSDVFEKTC